MADITREEQIDRITELSIHAGEKVAKTNVLHLTSNQGGMPHPDLYRSNMKKLAVKKIDKLIQSEITKAQEQLLDELESKAITMLSYPQGVPRKAVNVSYIQAKGKEIKGLSNDKR